MPTDPLTLDEIQAIAAIPTIGWSRYVVSAQSDHGSAYHQSADGVLLSVEQRDRLVAQVQALTQERAAVVAKLQVLIAAAEDRLKHGEATSFNQGYVSGQLTAIILIEGGDATNA